MKFVRIDYDNMINGPGVRAVLWVQGCRHQCRGCHNPETWNFDDGIDWTEDNYIELRDYLKRDYVDGVTISGGDPLDPKNVEEVLSISEKIKKDTGKTVWIYTGFDFDRLMCQGWYKKIVQFVDVVVDRPFVEKLKILGEYRGSSNQRYVDIHKTEQNGEVVQWQSFFDSKS